MTFTNKPVIPRRLLSFFGVLLVTMMTSAYTCHAYLMTLPCRRTEVNDMASRTSSSLIVLLSNDSDEEQEDHSMVEDSPLQTIGKGIDVVWSSSMFPAFLFMAPFLSNPNIRMHLSPPLLGIIITAVSAWYFVPTRLAEISNILDHRLEALRQIKLARQAQLAGSGTGESVAGAMKLYQDIVQQELALRYILPGIPILAPPEELVIDVRQYLKCDINQFGELVPIQLD